MSADLKSLRLFVTVADHGSISEGAKRCHIALAAASRRISDLEARARMPLLVRHARGVTLTSAGHGLLLRPRHAAAPARHRQRPAAAPRPRRCRCASSTSNSTTAASAPA
jgi:DNA-binding transcriptional LysR family regulator